MSEPQEVIVRPAPEGQFGKLVSIFAWIVTIGCAALAAMMLYTATHLEMAPAQGALCAMACGVAVVPYCFARAVDALRGK